MFDRVKAELGIPHRRAKSEKGKASYDSNLGAIRPKSQRRAREKGTAKEPVTAPLPGHPPRPRPHSNRRPDVVDDIGRVAVDVDLARILEVSLMFSDERGSGCVWPPGCRSLE